MRGVGFRVSRVARVVKETDRALQGVINVLGSASVAGLSSQAAEQGPSLQEDLMPQLWRDVVLWPCLKSSENLPATLAAKPANPSN